MNELEIAKFEKCKTELDKLQKSIEKSKTTTEVLSKQMEALKIRRKESEDSCLEKFGVPIKELQTTVKQKYDEYIECTERATEMFNKINQEQNLDGKSD